MSVRFEPIKDGAIEREEAFRHQCAIHAMQALLLRDSEEYDYEDIAEAAFFCALKMTKERRCYSSDWDLIEPEEESTTD